MPTNLLLLPLLGGYWFLHTLQYTRFRSRRLDGYRLLVESALVGVLFAVLSRIVVISLRQYPAVRDLWFTFAPADIPYLGTATGALLLCLVLPYLLNVLLNVTRILPGAEAQVKAVSRHGNHLLRLVHQASATEQPVSITLDNRKVYIGLVAAAPNLEPHDTFVSITPFFSGYRDDKTLELVLTVPYLKVYQDQDLDPGAFNVTLPISSIRIASLFDHTAYPYFVVEAAGESLTTSGS